MSLSKFGKFIFFILSYYLLFIFLLCDNEQLKEIHINLYFFSIALNWLIFILLTGVVFITTIYIFYKREFPKKVFEITNIENLSAETLNYLVTIVLGFFFFDSSIFSPKMFILLLLFYLVYQAGDMYYLQPMLMLIGYRVYKCRVDKGNNIMLITKSECFQRGKKEVYEITKGIYLIRGKEDDSD